MTGARGFVLVNALVLVGALAAAAMVLLVRAEMSVQRQAAWQGAAQVEAYLDALDELAIARLESDPVDGPDALSELWAKPIVAAELDRGDVSGQIVDLQGRFNVNWLAVTEDIAAQQAFDRLLVARGLPTGLGTAIRGFLAPGGPINAGAYAATNPATRPRGGPVRDPRQLLVIPELSPAQFAILEPVIAALPSDTMLNLNTASADVLEAWVAGVDGAIARSIFAQTARAPFASVEEFVQALPPAAAEVLDETRIAVNSGWFMVQGVARLEGRIQFRRTVLSRHPLPVGVLVDYRLPDG